MRALAVFHGDGTGPLVRILAPGFRHCFVCILDRNGTWIRFDGRAGIPEIRADAPAGFDLAGFYREQGFTVVEVVDREPQHPRTPLMLATCVGAAKRLLGLRAPFVLTPLQLHRHLDRQDNKRRDIRWPPSSASATRR
jgi:hypothetical protein